MTRGSRPRAVLFDAYETLLHLDDPVGRLARALDEAGYPNGSAAVARAFRTEVAFYRAHQDRGRDAGSLDALRSDCAEVLRAALDVVPPQDVAREALLRSLAWRVFDDAVPAIDALATAGYRLGVVSNWDISLLEVLAALGVADRFACVAVSAIVGVRKPAPGIFRYALERLGVAPGDAVHVGNDPSLDVRGATAAGMRAILVSRAGGSAPVGVPVVSRLTELPRYLEGV